MNETQFARKTTLDFYSPRKATKGVIKIKNNFYRLEKIQEIFEILQMPYKSVLFYGPPGGGKTQIAREVIAILLAFIFHLKVKISYNNLGDFSNNVSDFKYFPILENNNLRNPKNEETIQLATKLYN